VKASAALRGKNADAFVPDPSAATAQGSRDLGGAPEHTRFLDYEPVNLFRNRTI
jgi:hypothetical protein